MEYTLLLLYLTGSVPYSMGLFLICWTYRRDEWEEFLRTPRVLIHITLLQFPLYLPQILFDYYNYELYSIN